MKLRLEAQPGELREKGSELVKALAERVRPFNPALSLSLEKSLREASVELHWQVLRDLHGTLRKAYDGQLKDMLGDIDDVLDRAVEEEGAKSLEKSAAGGPYIGPKGGLWADAKHTIHWDPAKHGKLKADTKRRAEHARTYDGGERYDDDKATDVCISMGDELFETQSLDPNAQDMAGFSRYDMDKWGSVRGDLPRMRQLLYKYRRQVMDTGDYYKAGISAYDPKHGVKPKEAFPIQMAVHPSYNSLNISLGYIGDKKLWWDVHNYHKALDMWKDRASGAYVLRDWSDFDFEGYKKGLLEILPDASFPAGLPKVKTAKEKATEEQEAIKTAIASENPVDTVWRGLSDGSYKQAVGARYHPKDGTIEFRFPLSKVAKVFSNKAGYLTALTWWDLNSPKNAKSVRVFDIATAETALRYIKEAVPDFTVVTEGFEEARAQEDARQTTLQQPIPEVTAKINPKIKLFPYQNEGVRFLLEKKGNALIGDEMGLGKTVQVLSYAAVADKKTVVVCPPSVRRNWLQEAEKFFPSHFSGRELDASYVLKERRKLAKEKAAGTAPQGSDEEIIAERLGLNDANLMTINYHSVGKLRPYFEAAGFDLLVLDESHWIKNKNTAWTKEIQKLGDSAKHKILLSGTAVKNDRKDLITQVGMVKPGKYAMVQAYNEYGSYMQSELVRRTTGQLWSEMRDFYLARQKDMVLKDLPPKTLQIMEDVVADAPDLPTTVARLAKNEFWFARAEALEDGKSPGEAQEAGEQARYKIQEAAAEEGFDLSTSVEIGDYSRIKAALAQAKVPTTAKFVKEMLDSSDSNVIVFTNSRKAVEQLQATLNKTTPGVAEVYYGSTSKEDREKARAKFHKDTREPNEPARVLIGTMDTMKEGVTLTSADKVVFNDLPWTAMEARQSEARAHRPGQDKPVNVYWMTAKDNDMETALSTLLKYKIEMTKKVNEGRTLTSEERRWLGDKVTMSQLLDAVREGVPKAELGDQPQTVVSKDGAPVTTEVHAPKPKARRGPGAKIPSHALVVLDGVAEQAADTEGFGLEPEEVQAYQELDRAYDRTSDKLIFPNDREAAERMAGLLTDLSNDEDAEATKPANKGTVAAKFSRHAATGLGTLASKVRKHAAKLPKVEPETAKAAPAPVKYRYAMQNRPLGMGAQPKGFTGVEEHPDYKHGIIVYDKPLTPEEAKSYELRPMLTPEEVQQQTEATADRMREYASGHLEMAKEDPRYFRQQVASTFERRGPGHVDDMDKVVEDVRKILEAHVTATSKPEPEKPEHQPEAGEHLSLFDMFKSQEGGDAVPEKETDTGAEDKTADDEQTPLASWDGKWQETTKDDPERYDKESAKRVSKHMLRLAGMRKSGNLPGSVLDAVALFAITSKGSAEKAQARVWPQIEEWTTKPEEERKPEELTQIMRPLGVQNQRTEEFARTKAMRSIFEEGTKKFADQGPELRDWLRDHPGFEEHGGGSLANAKISFCLELLGYQDVAGIDARVIQHLTGAKGDAATKLSKDASADGNTYRKFEQAIADSASYKEDDPEELRLGMAQWRMWSAEGGSDTDHAILWQTVAQVTGTGDFAKAMSGGISLLDFWDALQKAEEGPKMPPKPQQVDGGDDYEHDGQDHHDGAQIVSMGILRSFAEFGPSAPVHYDAVPVLSGLAMKDGEDAAEGHNWSPAEDAGEDQEEPEASPTEEKPEPKPEEDPDKKDG